ncbi:MAG: transporter [Rubritepida sp.]|nr:transporter [Rubritepida sp.]
MRRRSALLLPLLATPAIAQTRPGAFPSRPITVVVPYVPGGPSDILARSVAAPMLAMTGQPFIVENRPGANGSIAGQFVARAEPDGHTLLIGASGPMSVNPNLLPNLPYDTLRDFAPLCLGIIAPNLLAVHQSFADTGPASQGVANFIAWLKAHPGELSYGSPGIGSSEHLTTELFSLMTGTQLNHVPYPGAGAAITDLISGTYQGTFISFGPALPHVQSGRLRALGVSSLERHRLLPDVPAVSETVAGFEAFSWQSFVAPKATPEPVQAKLNELLVTALRMPAVDERLQAIGYTVAASSREECKQRFVADLARWADVIRRANLSIR